MYLSENLNLRAYKFPTTIYCISTQVRHRCSEIMCYKINLKLLVKNVFENDSMENNGKGNSTYLIINKNSTKPTARSHPS